LLFSCNRIGLFDGFSKITSTNEFGDLLGLHDETDWQITDDFKRKENALFDISYDKWCSYDIDEYNIIAFPNPAANNVHIHFEIPEDKSISFRLVDRSYETFISVDDPDSDFQIDLANLGLSGQFVRLYYKIYGDDCELKGHGDIQVN